MTSSQIAEDERDERTVRLADGIEDNVIALIYGVDFMDELGGLSQAKRLFDVVIVDCTQSGFFFPADVLVKCADVARDLLEVQGALVFVKTDRALAFIKENVVGLLTFHTFETLSQVYEYSPTLGRQIEVTLGSKTNLNEDGTDLSEQILMSCIPILTTFGIKLKAGMESTKRRNLVLAALDNYSPLSAIAQKLGDRMSFDEVLDELRSLEESGAIYPLFAKIPFVVHCFRNKQPFKLKDYLLHARLVSQDQLDNLLFSIQQSKNSDRLNIGAMCVAKGLISARQLEVAMQDQAFFGQSAETDKLKLNQEQERRVQSLVGHLGNTDPAGVLQSLTSNRETGVLSVEHKDLQFRALFEQGKLLNAKQGKLKGNAAVTEFVSVWKEGIFVFIERQPPTDLADESCKVTRPLDKLLLDSALATDNIEVVWKKLPRGAESPLEKIEDANNLFESGSLTEPQDNSPLSEDEINNMQRIWKECDGLVAIGATIRKLGNLTTAQGSAAVGRLLHYQLLKVPAMDLSAPLEKFQAIAMNVSNRLGLERSNALLRLSLQASQGYSAKARMFSIGSAGEVGVDLTLARLAGLSLSHIVKQLEDWQVKYIEYVSQELDKNLLRDIVYRVHQRHNPQ